MPTHTRGLDRRFTVSAVLVLDNHPAAAGSSAQGVAAASARIWRRKLNLKATFDSGSS